MTDPVRRPVWLGDGLALVLHERLVADFGGLAGVRDRGLLESATARPRQIVAYGSADIVELAAAYAAGIVRNHPFIDGNKRVAVAAAEVFLLINGHELVAPDAAVEELTMGVARGAVSKTDVTRFFNEHVVSG